MTRASITAPRAVTAGEAGPASAGARRSPEPGGGGSPPDRPASQPRPEAMLAGRGCGGTAGEVNAAANQFSTVGYPRRTLLRAKVKSVLCREV